MSTAIVIGILIVLTILSGRSGNKFSAKKEEIEKKHIEDLLKINVDTTALVEAGRYIGGHPAIDYPSSFVRVYRNITHLLLYHKHYKTTGISTGFSIDYLGEIQLSLITEITIEDQSSVQQKVSAGRFLLVGVAALAWTKDKKTERAFLIISWSDSGFTHNTIFEYKGLGAFTSANTARNQLIRLISHNPNPNLP